MANLHSLVLSYTARLNEMIWICEKQEYRAKLRYKGGLLTATIVTFIPGNVRIIQVTCNPSDKLPKLIFTLRAIYNFGKDNYDKSTAYDVMKWILSPPEAPPAKELAMRGKK
ncbi:uncharacterized protein CIMG_04666 [Coccidioides immitis RS]|uniref:Uncharacterized protein n=3 Tax=Coccidioides immitis TaxID=5501 RepID=A0A0D8JUN7_COCIM|nr:uncharacterized protein CIMG_04666 [Coccidioides immitis RS]KJF61017.1 hypothetical protein CIMG_04666 [Coccidioides immitis RS]KMP04830.1 hypothetical protein CIRG_04511 [Coccidioides immitis RMSCC 2394]KMU86325.1 hypothetical protein CIHG_04114 [Coccidioides immitis H538.4]TPX21310.1 hypothetical protein DIZ76_015266 [Coccidioides immitis]